MTSSERHREPVGYIIDVSGTTVHLNLLDHHRGLVAAHYQGISEVASIGCLLGIESGEKLVVLKVFGMKFSEPFDVHRTLPKGQNTDSQPLRQLSGSVIGIISRVEGKPKFTSGSLVSPALGSKVYPLVRSDINTILQRESESNSKIHIGTEVNSNTKVWVPLDKLIGQHVAVLGSTGHGKSCFTASVLQQISRMKGARVVVFDVNGEYGDALQGLPGSGQVKVTKIEGKNQIPYFALGRLGLQRLLLPSEKSQRPALTFAIQSLPYVWEEDGGVALIGCKVPCLFDDCREQEEEKAKQTIEKLRKRIELKESSLWPPMSAIGPLVADSYSLSKDRFGKDIRSSFRYEHVAPMINRLHALVSDPVFCSVVDVNGGLGTVEPLDFAEESKKLATKYFGDNKTKWRVHIVDLSTVPRDLLQFLLGALLELLTTMIYDRGQSNKIPTLLVLEEAHHYLLQTVTSSDGYTDAPAYERLSKEGRKYGLALWISTQRPSEVSETVLSQCSNWFSFRLTNKKDQQSVSAATEWANDHDLRRIALLPVQENLAFGGGLPIPMHLRAPNAEPQPRSESALFNEWNKTNQSNRSTPRDKVSNKQNTS